MPEWIIQLVLAIGIACIYPLVFKTNSLFAKMVTMLDKTAEKETRLEKLLEEAIKSLRHNEKEHIQIIHALENLTEEIKRFPH